MAQQLDPQTLALLQQILGSSQMGAMNSNGSSQWGGADGTALDDWVINRTQGRRYEGGDAGGWTLDPSQDSVMFSKPTEGAGGKVSDWWNPDGTYGGQHQAQGGGTRDMNQAIAMVLGGYFGGGALGDAYGAAGAAGAEGAAGLTGLDAAMADLAASGGLTPASMGGAEAAGAGAAAGGGAGTASTLGQLGSAVKPVVDALGGGGGVAALLGGVAGALDGGDKEQTSDRDPWAPAQDFLKRQIAQGDTLSQQYQAQPFSEAQQTAYGNFGGLLDLINTNAAGLLAGPQANAMGANTFKRGQTTGLNAMGANTFKRGQTTGLLGSTFNPTAAQWQPGLLGSFGTRG